MTRAAKGISSSGPWGLIRILPAFSTMAPAGRTRRSYSSLPRGFHAPPSIAASLNALFVNLAQRAYHNQYVDQFERNLRLALKAQGQCRTTIETLLQYSWEQGLSERKLTLEEVFSESTFEVSRV